MNSEEPEVEPSKGRSTFAEIFLNGSLLTISILVGLVLLEVGARVWLVHSADEKQFLQYASLKQLQERFGTSQSYQFALHRYLGYYPTPNLERPRNRHNSLGYRGEEIALPKPEGEFRIVCMGGSTTYTTRVPDYRRSYPALLEKELRERGHPNVTVINAGVGSWSSWETLINFQFRILDLDPDMVIVYHGINDIHPRLVWPPEAYRGDNSGRRIANDSGLIMPDFREYSTFLRTLLVSWGHITPHSALSTTISKEPPTFYGDDFQSQKVRNVYPQGIFTEVSAQKMLEVNDPRYFRRNLENIASIANDRGIQTILATFAFSRKFENEPRVSSREYITAYAEMNEVVSTVARERGVHLFDFARVFPDDPRYYVDGRHVNNQGSAFKARLFASFIVEQGLIDPEPPALLSSLPGEAR